MSLAMEQVVLAEDDYEISRLVESYFRRAYGLSVATTDKVEGILPLVLETRASVLIMDLELTDGDATRVLSDVADIEGLIVVILTGTWKGRQENKLLEDGAQVVMRKPQKPSTIWQQVLNLRRVLQQGDAAPLRIRAKGQGVFYNVRDGIITDREGNQRYLSDKKREIMDVLVRNLAACQDMSKQEEVGTGGWVKREDMIKGVFGPGSITPDLENSFWYHLRNVKATLNECVMCEGDMEPIENKRAGRSESFYRLNPSLFSLTQGKEA